MDVKQKERMKMLLDAWHKVIPIIDRNDQMREARIGERLRKGLAESERLVAAADEKLRRELIYGLIQGLKESSVLLPELSEKDRKEIDDILLSVNVRKPTKAP